MNENTYVGELLPFKSELSVMERKNDDGTGGVLRRHGSFELRKTCSSKFGYSIVLFDGKNVAGIPKRELSSNEFENSEKRYSGSSPARHGG